MVPLPGTPLAAVYSMGWCVRGSPLRLLLLPLPSCKPDKVNTIASSAYHMSSKKRVMNLRWGLHRGLLSGLLSTTSGVFEAPARGWLLAEVLALFTLWANVSASLQKQKGSR